METGSFSKFTKKCIKIKEFEKNFYEESFGLFNEQPHHSTPQFVEFFSRYSTYLYIFFIKT